MGGGVSEPPVPPRTWSGRGGRRPGAGRPPGSTGARTEDRRRRYSLVLKGQDPIALLGQVDWSIVLRYQQWAAARSGGKKPGSPPARAFTKGELKLVDGALNRIARTYGLITFHPSDLQEGGPTQINLLVGIKLDYPGGVNGGEPGKFLP